MMLTLMLIFSFRHDTHYVFVIADLFIYLFTCMLIFCRHLYCFSFIVSGFRLLFRFDAMLMADFTLRFFAIDAGRRRLPLAYELISFVDFSFSLRLTDFSSPSFVAFLVYFAFFFFAFFWLLASLDYATLPA